MIRKRHDDTEELGGTKLRKAAAERGSVDSPRTKPPSARARVQERPDGKPLPYKYTPARAQAIVAALAVGAHVETACKAAGLTKATYYSWKREGKADGSGPLWDFSEDVIAAEAHAELQLIEQVRSAGIVDWKAAAWMLEKRYRKRYGDDMSPEKIQALVAKELKALLAEAQKKIDDAAVGKGEPKQITDGRES